MAKLLLVEDDNNLREIYEARLQAEGFTIVSAKDGEEALVVAKAEKPDLVISDVMMPKISGFEMLDILRNTDELKNVKVIMLTALGQSDDQERADKLGADRYLVKSQVTLEDIVKVTHELLEDQGAPAPSVPAPVPDTATEAATPVAEPPATKPATSDSGAKPAAPAPPDPAPKPEPAPEPKPEPKPEPTSDPAPVPKPDTDASASDDVAESTVQEEADVEAKIEDFVAGASSEPTAPSATAGKPASAPNTDESKNASSASDDKLMADAVETLVASTDKNDPVTPAPADNDAKDDSAAAAATLSTPTVIPVSTAPNPKPATPSAVADTTPASLDPDKPANASVSHTLIIEPPESEPKKNINDLLAVEEAKTAQTIPGTTIVSNAGGDEDKAAGEPPVTPGTTPPAEDTPAEPDPNSIAL